MPNVSSNYFSVFVTLIKSDLAVSATVLDGRFHVLLIRGYLMQVRVVQHTLSRLRHKTGKLLAERVQQTLTVDLVFKIAERTVPANIR